MITMPRSQISALTHSVVAFATAAGCAVALILGLVTAPAWAADVTPEITWSVAPAGEDGPDGRRWFEFDLDPGETVTDHVAVTNGSEDPVVFALQAADGYTTQNGRYSILADPSESKDSGTWVQIQPRVEVGPGECVVVPFTVTAPRLAEPGDHPAGIAATVASGPQEGGGAGVQLASRFAVAVMTRVTGDLDPSLEINSAEVRYRWSWNPLRPGALIAAFDLSNTGNARLTVSGKVEAGGRAVSWPAEGEMIGLMPGESRRVETQVPAVWPLFRVGARVIAKPVVTASGEGDVPEVAPVTAGLSAWAIPWPQLLALAGVALAAGAALGSRRRTNRRLRDAAARAREEALAEAGGSPVPEKPAPPTRRQAREAREGRR
jgi:hypothetical protein